MKLCDEFPLSRHRVENISPKAPSHSLAYAIVHLQKGRYFLQFYEEFRQSIPRPSKPTKLCILEKDRAVFFYTSTTHGQRQFKQPESRVCSDELGALAGWWSLLLRCPWRRDLSLRLSFATVSIPTEAAFSSQAASLGRECFWNIHTSEEITFVSVDCEATTGWRDEQGKTTGVKEEGKKKAECGKWKASCDFSLPKWRKELCGLCWGSFMRAGNRCREQIFSSFKDV